MKKAAHSISLWTSGRDKMAEEEQVEQGRAGPPGRDWAATTIKHVTVRT